MKLRSPPTTEEIGREPTANRDDNAVSAMFHGLIATSSPRSSRAGTTRAQDAPAHLSLKEKTEHHRTYLRARVIAIPRCCARSDRSLTEDTSRLAADVADARPARGCPGGPLTRKNGLRHRRANLIVPQRSVWLARLSAAAVGPRWSPQQSVEPSLGRMRPSRSHADLAAAVLSRRPGRRAPHLHGQRRESLTRIAAEPMLGGVGSHSR